MGSEKPIFHSFSQVPINRYFGFRLLSSSPQESVVSMEVLPEHIQEQGIVHGSILTAVADTAAVYTFYPNLAKNRSMTSVEFKINFLRPAKINQGSLTARARVIQQGQKIGLCDVEVTQSDKLVAKGLFTYLFFDCDRSKPPY